MKICCDTGKEWCKMTDIDKLMCNHDHCTGPEDNGIVSFEDLTYLQKIRIIQQEVDCCPNTYILDLFEGEEELWDEIKQHPDWLKAQPSSDPYEWKDLMQNAEWDVKAKWALSIYNAVKTVLDKGDKLG